MPRDYRTGQAGAQRNKARSGAVPQAPSKVLAARQQAFDDMKKGPGEGFTRPGSQNGRK